MDKKILALLLIVIIVIAGIIGYVVTQNKKEAAVTTNQKEKSTQSVPEEMTPEFVKALQGKGSVKCTYTYSDATTTTYIKDGKIRTEVTSRGITNNSIIVNKMLYSWMTGQKTGIMMDTTKVSVSITPGVTENQNYKDVDSLKDDLMKYKPKCSNETISDSMFETPTDVTFTDYSKMMNDIKSKIPANVTIPKGYEMP